MKCHDYLRWHGDKRKHESKNNTKVVILEKKISIFHVFCGSDEILNLVYAPKSLTRELVNVIGLDCNSQLLWIV